MNYHSSLESALGDFSKKFRAKTGHKWEDRLAPPKPGKYAFIERNYEGDSDDSESEDASKGKVKAEKKEEDVVIESTLPLPVQNLMELIFNDQFFAATMQDLNYDKNKLPLGKLSKRTLQQGYQALKSLSEEMGDLDYVSSLTTQSGQRIIELSNLYYTLIPHAFGRRVPPVIRSYEMLKKEVELLESLSDMSIAQTIMKDARKDEGGVHIADRQFAGLGMAEMTALDQNSSEFKELNNYLQGSKGATHAMRFQAQEIFRIERAGEHDRFFQSPYAKLKGDRRLLWHGSRATNFGGILSQGLRIAPPEAPVSGYMFGKGVYLADISSKSANYCCSYLSGNVGLLLLCEAELGNPLFELTDSDYNAGERAKSSGCYSTWGKGLTAPAGWKDAGCVHESLKGVLMVRG
jgi:poly [ADP-ribose] polymerase 2/3/4